MHRTTAFGLLMTVGVLSMTVAAFQQPAQRAVLPDLQKVKDNLYM